MSTYEEFMIILNTGLLIVAILNLKNKKQHPRSGQVGCYFYNSYYTRNGQVSAIVPVVLLSILYKLSKYLSNVFWKIPNRILIRTGLGIFAHSQQFNNFCHRIVTKTAFRVCKPLYLLRSFKNDIKHFLLTAQIYFFRYTS